jgi:phage shock protein C
MQKRLVKSSDKKVFGVCGGLGNYFDIDPTLIRIAFLFGFIIFGSGLLLYIIMAIVMPSE